MQTTTVLIDGCGYGVVEALIPKMGPTGPTGETIEVRDLLFEETQPPSQTRVTIRFTPEGFEEFIRTISGKKVVPATAQDLLALNHGPARKLNGDT